MIIHNLICFLFRTFNRWIAPLFGTVDGEPRIHCRWQNLKEDRQGNPRGIPWAGRCRFRLSRRSRQDFGLCFEWNVGSLMCWLAGASIVIDRSGGGDDDVCTSIRLWPVSLYFVVDGLLPRSEEWVKKYGYEAREISFDLSSRAFRWRLWADPNSWSSLTPRWRDGFVSLDDTILGRSTYREEEIQWAYVDVPMPEGAYPARMRLYDASWSRPRWVTKRRPSFEIVLEVPIPHMGKGENSWDCGADALHGMGGGASTLEEGIAKVTQGALRSRRRHDGDVMARYPAPIAAAA